VQKTEKNHFLSISGVTKTFLPKPVLTPGNMLSGKNGTSSYDVTHFWNSLVYIAHSVCHPLAYIMRVGQNQGHLSQNYEI